MYLLSCHFPEERVMVCINRFFYEEFFVEKTTQGGDAKKNLIDLEKIFWQSLKFIAKYFKLCSTSMEIVGTDLDAVIEEVFPDLSHYLLDLRCLRGLKKLEAASGRANLEDLSVHLDVLLPADWPSLYSIAELDEHRRGLSIRYVTLLTLS